MIIAVQYHVTPCNSASVGTKRNKLYRHSFQFRLCGSSSARHIWDTISFSRFQFEWRRGRSGKRRRRNVMQMAAFGCSTTNTLASSSNFFCTLARTGNVAVFVYYTDISHALFPSIYRWSSMCCILYFPIVLSTLLRAQAWNFLDLYLSSLHFVVVDYWSCLPHIVVFFHSYYIALLYVFESYVSVSVCECIFFVFLFAALLHFVRYLFPTFHFLLLFFFMLCIKSTHRYTPTSIGDGIT